MCNNFGRFCDAAAQLGLTAALEAPVNSRTVNTLPLALQLIAEIPPPQAFPVALPEAVASGHP